MSTATKDILVGISMFITGRLIGSIQDGWAQLASDTLVIFGAVLFIYGIVIAIKYRNRPMSNTNTKPTETSDANSKKTLTDSEYDKKYGDSNKSIKIKNKYKITREAEAEELAFKAYHETGSRKEYQKAYNTALNGNTIQSPTEAELAKIGIIKLGYKEVNNISLADKDVQELPDKQLERYYQAGIKAIRGKK